MGKFSRFIAGRTCWVFGHMLYVDRDTERLECSRCGCDVYKGTQFARDV